MHPEAIVLAGFLGLLPASVLQASPASGGQVVAQGTTLTPDAKRRLAERVEKSLADSGMTFTKAGEGWQVQFSGKYASFHVSVIVLGDLAVLQSQRLSSKPLTPAQMVAVLEQSFQRDLAKLGLVQGGLVAATEVDVRTLDGPLMRRLLDSVAALADHAFGLVNDAGTDAANYTPLTLAANARNLESLTLNGGAASLRYDKSSWKSTGARNDLNFQHVSGEAGFRVVAERMKLSYDELERVAIANARNADPAATVVRRGWRLVNGDRLMVLEIQATVSGLPWTYLGHYYAGPAGTIQIVTWTTTNLLETHRAAFDAIASGFQLKK